MTNNLCKVCPADTLRYSVESRPLRPLRLVKTENILITAEKGRDHHQVWIGSVRCSAGVNKLSSVEVKMVYIYSYFFLNEVNM